MLLAGIAVVGAALRGGSGPPRPPAWAASPRPVDHTGPVLGRSAPRRIAIPSIGVRSALITLGLNEDGTVGTPPADRPQLAGWYSPGPAPGERGAAVVLGHVDGRRGPAVFYELGRLRPGNTIEVSRQDGTVAVFRVESIEQTPKHRFPTRKVYGPVDHAALRLITCGGAFDRKARSYRDNIIVYAYQTATR